MWNPWVTRDISSLIISESIGVFGPSNTWVSRYSTSLIISESLGLFGPSNTWVSRYSCSLIISESLGAVWAVESMGLPLQHFVDYF
jgi:hypothetical protein